MAGKAQSQTGSAGSSGAGAATVPRSLSRFERAALSRKVARSASDRTQLWVGEQALQGAGLVGRGRKRGVHRKRRARRPLPRMLLHIDGSGIVGCRTSAGTP